MVTGKQVKTIVISGAQAVCAYILEP